MNLRVAASVAHGTGYGFRYGVFFPFPAQTDGPFVLPAAAVFRVFGIGPASAQAVSVAYLLGFAAVAAELLRAFGGGTVAVLSGLAATLALPGMRDYATGGYGEVPALCWLLLGLRGAMRGASASGRDRWFALAGLALGTAAITKTAALLAVAPATAVIAAMLAAERRWRALVLLLAGAAALPAGWELFRFAVLGGPAPWLDWWRLQLDQVGRQSGGSAARPALGPILVRVRAHAGVLAAQTGAPRPLLAAFLALPWIAAARYVRRAGAAPERRMVVVAVSAASACLFGWWLGLAPDGMTWLRRILPGLALQALLVAALLADGEWRRSRTARLPAILALPVAGLLLMAAHGTRGPGLAASLHRRAEVMRVAAIRALPADAVLFGSGWWQAPALTLFSGREAENFERWAPERVAALPLAFFLSDRDGTEIGGAPETLLADIAVLRPVARTPDAALWRMVAVDPALPMRGGGDGPAFDATTSPQAPGVGWFPSAGGWAWVRPDSTLALRRRGERVLVLDAAFWSELFPAGRPLRLRARSAGCLDREVSVPGAGLRRLVLPLSCAPAATAVPFLLELHTDRTMPVPRQLDADTRSRSFEISRAALEAAAG